MTDQIKESESVSESPVYVEMTAAEYEAKFRELQLGNTDVLPTGEKASDIFEKLLKLEKEQEAARDEIARRGKSFLEAVSSTQATPAGDDKVRVFTASNGVSAVHSIESGESEVAVAGVDGGLPPKDSDIPEDFPGREHLIKAGGDFASWAYVQTLSIDDFDSVPGIGQATADKAIAYIDSLKA